MGAGEELADFVRIAVRGLCDRAEAVTVSLSTPSNDTVHLELSCAKADMPKVMGRQGKNIGAVRTLLYGIAAKHRAKVFLVIKE